jgi:hypothetical protein
MGDEIVNLKNSPARKHRARRSSFSRSRNFLRSRSFHSKTMEPIALRTWLRFIRHCLAGIAMASLLVPVWADGPKPEGLKGDPRPKPENRPGKAPDDLSPEERRRLDDVLAKAWTDPAVIQAREQVHAATDNYRKALRDAVERIDPAAAPLMGKLHDKSRLEAMRRKFPMPGPPGMGPFGPDLPPDPAGAIPSIANQEANLRHLQGPDRERFLQLAKQIQDSGTLKPEVKQTFETWTRGGRDAAKTRRELRERFLAEMRKLDPWAAELLKKDPLAEGKGKEKDKDGKGPKEGMQAPPIPPGPGPVPPEQL